MSHRHNTRNKRNARQRIVARWTRWVHFKPFEQNGEWFYEAPTGGYTADGHPYYLTFGPYKSECAAYSNLRKDYGMDDGA